MNTQYTLSCELQGQLLALIITTCNWYIMSVTVALLGAATSIFNVSVTLLTVMDWHSCAFYMHPPQWFRSHVLPGFIAKCNHYAMKCPFLASMCFTDSVHSLAIIVWNTVLLPLLFFKVTICRRWLNTEHDSKLPPCWVVSHWLKLWSNWTLGSTPFSCLWELWGRTSSGTTECWSLMD